MAVVLITGCTRGIGLLTALHFCREGHDVFASVRDMSGARDLQMRSDSENLPIEILSLDVTDDAPSRPRWRRFSDRPEESTFS